MQPCQKKHTCTYTTVKPATPNCRLPSCHEHPEFTRSSSPSPITQNNNKSSKTLATFNWFSAKRYARRPFAEIRNNNHESYRRGLAMRISRAKQKTRKIMTSFRARSGVCENVRRRHAAFARIHKFVVSRALELVRRRPSK